jgi:deazaflavin-dependent oxidoreductase (nitroreductase family)
MSEREDWNSKIINEFRANKGVVGGMFENMPLLLFTHLGAKSGQTRTNPVAYLKDGNSYAIIASKGGAPENPGWYYNLVANPQSHIEVGTEQFDVTVAEAKGAERDRLYAAMVAKSPVFGEYAQKTKRTIPVLLFTPTSK